MRIPPSFLVIFGLVVTLAFDLPLLLLKIAEYKAIVTHPVQFKLSHFNVP